MPQKPENLYKPPWVKNQQNIQTLIKALNTFGIFIPAFYNPTFIAISELDIQTAIRYNANKHQVPPENLAKMYFELLYYFRKKGFEILNLTFSTLPLTGINTRAILQELGITLSEKSRNTLLSALYIPKPQNNSNDSSHLGGSEKIRQFQVLDLSRKTNQGPQNPSSICIYEIELPEGHVWLTDEIQRRNKNWLIENGLVELEENIGTLDVAKLLFLAKFNGEKGIRKFFKLIKKVYLKYKRLYQTDDNLEEILGIPFYRLVFRFPDNSHPQVGTLHFQIHQDDVILNMIVGTINVQRPEDLERIKESFSYDVKFIRTKEKQNNTNQKLFQPGKYFVVISLTIEEFLKIYYDAETALHQNPNQIPIGGHSFKGGEYLIWGTIISIIDDGIEHPYIKFLQIKATEEYYKIQKRKNKKRRGWRLGRTYRNRKPAIPARQKSIFGCNTYSPVEYQCIKY